MEKKQTAMQQLCNKITERIQQLKEADVLFCTDRWDMSKNKFERMAAREGSKYVTERRHELEDLLNLVIVLKDTVEKSNIVEAKNELRLIVVNEYNRLQELSNKYEGTESAYKYAHKCMAVRDVLKMINI